MLLDKVLNSFWVRLILICICTVFTVYSTNSFATIVNGVQSGSISISGEVYGESCVVNGAAGAHLNLPSVPLTKILTTGSSVGKTLLKITLSGCPDIKGITLSLEADGSVLQRGDAGVLLNTATINEAKNIGIKITDPNNDGVDFNNYVLQVDGLQSSGKDKELQLYVHYHVLSTSATPGTVESGFTYRITYP